MPTTKKRINLTVPDDLYEKLQEYKEKHGVESDASACLQLVAQQLRGLEQTEAMLDFIKRGNIEQLMQASKEGIEFMKNEL